MTRYPLKSIVDAISPTVDSVFDQVLSKLTYLPDFQFYRLLFNINCVGSIKTNTGIFTGKFFKLLKW